MNQYFLTVASEFISQQKIASIIELNSKYLNKLNCEQITSNQLLKVEELNYFVITGGTEQQILNLVKKRNQKFNEEVVLLAHTSHNSLPASLEVLARLQQDGSKGKIIYLPEISKILDNNHKPEIQDLNEKQALNGTRIGLIGEPSDWLVASSPKSEIVQNTWGSEIITVDLSEVEQLIKKIKQNEIIEIKHDFVSKAKSIEEPSEIEIDDNIRVYLALKKLIKKYELDALTIRCFDLVLDLKTTGCFALSRLNDEGIIAGCEGDLNSTIGMIWAQKNFGKLPWMANPSQINLKENSVILAHCTVPCSLVSEYRIRSHFESGLGVGIQGEFPLQKVTLLRIGGKNLDKIWQVEGKIIQTGNDDNLCRTQIEVKLNSDCNVADLLTEPLGNHLIVVPGIFEELTII